MKMHVRVKQFLPFFLLITGSFWIGVAFNYFGFIFEAIKVEVHVKVDELGKTGSHPDGHDGLVVPNVVHYIWFATNDRKNLSFLNYISIRSAAKIQKPEAVFLHCNFLPSGAWWTRLIREVTITVVHREPPVKIHGQTIRHVYHRGDVAKIEVLLENGGIYMDYDVIVVNSLDPVRRHDVTLGREKPPKLNAGVMVARKGALFMRLLLESYRNNYRAFDWDYNCARVAYGLALARPDLVNIEPFRFTTPDWLDRRQLFDGLVDWRSLYLIHVMGHGGEADHCTPDSIRRMNNTIGEVMRYIYYGDSKLMDGKTLRRKTRAH